jgi:restriction system protein
MAAHARTPAGRSVGAATTDSTELSGQDAFGLDRVHVQAKRYKLDTVISEPDIRRFAGSLEGAKATKGVFVTPAYFTAQARRFADRIARRIVLIDGQQLAQLMIKHDVGVRIEETLYIYQEDRRRLFFIPE